MQLFKCDFAVFGICSLHVEQSQLQFTFSKVFEWFFIVILIEMYLYLNLLKCTCILVYHSC